MKKKPILWASLAIVGVLIVAGVVWGKQYYENRYVGSDYYAMVPQDYDMTSTPIHNKNGEVAASGITYKLTAYNAEGESKAVSFTVYDADSPFSRGEVQPQPGTFLKISASKQLVVGWGVTETSVIPDQALQLIASLNA